MTATGPLAGTVAIVTWERMIALNVNGVLYVTKAALPHLVSAAGEAPRQVADIVNISSTAGRVARPGSAVYNLTKFGLNAFSEALRQELLPHRVRVAIVEPGTVDTELVLHVEGDAAAAARGARGFDRTAQAGRHRRCRGPHRHPGSPGRGQRDARARRRANLVAAGSPQGRKTSPPHRHARP
jgi:NADP-dependent 3-hydroxy acid dehydrogenase YdfG